MSKTQKVHRVGNFTILQVMVFLAVVGLLATWVLHHFFPS